MLLLDEPLSNLDASLRLRMRGELKRLQRKTGMTMIFVTHDQEEALSLSDRIAVMKQGCIVQNGTPEEIYYEPANEEIAAFIGKTNPDFLRPEELLSDGGSGCSLYGAGAAVYGIPYRVSGNRWRKKLAGQSVRAGREPFPAWNEGAAGHAGKTLLRKNIRVCILTDPDIFSILNIPYGGIQKGKRKKSCRKQNSRENAFLFHRKLRPMKQKSAPQGCALGAKVDGC